MKKLQRFLLVSALGILVLFASCETGPSAPSEFGTVDVSIELKDFSDVSRVVVYAEDLSGKTGYDSKSLSPNILKGKLRLPAGEWRIVARVLKDDQDESVLAVGRTTVTVAANESVQASITIDKGRTGFFLTVDEFEGAVRYKFSIDEMELTDYDSGVDMPEGKYNIYGRAYDSYGMLIGQGNWFFHVKKGEMTDIVCRTDEWNSYEYSISTEPVEGAASYWLYIDDCWREWHEGMKVKSGYKRGSFYMQARDSEGKPMLLATEDDAYSKTKVHFSKDMYSEDGVVIFLVKFPDMTGNGVYYGLDREPQHFHKIQKTGIWITWGGIAAGKHYVKAELVDSEEQILNTLKKDFETSKGEICTIEVDLTPSNV